MGKYDALTEHLRGIGREVRMSFADIERVIGTQLPERSKSVRAWWSNNPSNNVMTRAWLAAGFKTAQVDVAGEVLSFVPDLTTGFSEMAQHKFQHQPALPKPAGDKPFRHPAWGALKGMITIPPEVDLTEPSYADWKALYGEDK